MGKIKQSRKRRGQAIIEGALVLLIMVNILIGILDIGQVLFTRQTFTARVRAAARYGAVTNADETAIKNMVLYGQATVPDGAPAGAFGLTTGMISVEKLDVGSNEQRVVVTISGFPYRFYTPWIHGVFTGRNIAASAPLETL
jgi:Flp pilus assembly protein TadG